MTETQSRAPQPVPAGLALAQAVGRAQSNLSRLLAGVLAETGTARDTYLALQRLAALGDAAGRDAFVRDLADSLGIDLWTAAERADALVADGLLSPASGDLRPTDAAVELRNRIGRSIGDVTGPLWAQFDPADLETTVRTLKDIAARALYPAAAPSAATGGRS